MTKNKNSESDYFIIPPPKSEYFFRNIGNQNIFLEKKHRKPPHPLEVKWSVPKRILYPFFHEYIYNVIGFSKTCRWTNRL
jgi:hypothetical protein